MDEDVRLSAGAGGRGHGARAVREQQEVPVIMGGDPLSANLPGGCERQQPQILQLAQEVLLCGETSEHP